MSMKPVVSVIVLTYNQERTVGRAIESVLAQKCDVPFEIVVSDDCSTDVTRLVCQRFADRYPDKVRLLPPAPNRGVVDNYFETLMVCEGRYIADCAGDDYWIDENRLQRQVEMLDADAEMTVVHADWVCVDATTGETLPSDAQNRNADVHAREMDGRALLTALLQHRTPAAMHLSTAMYRAEVIRGMISRDRDMVWNRDMGCEDYPVIAALLAHGRVGYMAVPVLAYRVGGDTVSSPSDMRRAAEFHARTAVATVRLARYYGVPLCYLRESLAEKMRFALSQAYHLGDRALGEEIRRVQKDNGIPVGRRYNLLQMVMRYKPVWRLVHVLHSIWSRGS